MPLQKMFEGYWIVLGLTVGASIWISGIRNSNIRIAWTLGLPSSLWLLYLIYRWGPFISGEITASDWWAWAFVAGWMLFIVTLLAQMLTVLLFYYLRKLYRWVHQKWTP